MIFQFSIGYIHVQYTRGINVKHHIDHQDQTMSGKLGAVFCRSLYAGLSGCLFLIKIDIKQWTKNTTQQELLCYDIINHFMHKKWYVQKE